MYEGEVCRVVVLQVKYVLSQAMDRLLARLSESHLDVFVLLAAMLPACARIR